ncbi:MAG: prephenate dehydrogenase [Rhodoferax sp.]|nr:prephenate dehydrogenase [Rhodoferax sp.]
MFRQLGLIGCGLMGGSFALALKQAGLVDHVVGYSQSPSSSKLAEKMGVIDLAVPHARLAAWDSDLVLLAVPVSASEASLKAIRREFNPHTDLLIMDVGSTKGDVAAAAERALGSSAGLFVPAHPIAGKEVSGVAHADASLYAGKKVILTPTHVTSRSRLQKAKELWHRLGCSVETMTPEHHDAAFAAVSHLPHLLAFALVNAISQQPLGAQFLSLAGPGFRDFSRIAASEPRMWRDILLANRKELQAQIHLFRHQLAALEDLISNADAETLERLIAQASSTRADWTLNGKPLDSKPENGKPQP